MQVQISRVLAGHDMKTSLRWRHNGCDSVWNHQPQNCLLSRLFGRTSKKTSKLRVTGLCAGNSPVTGEIPAQMASDTENVSIWWRYHVSLTKTRTCCSSSWNTLEKILHAKFAVSCCQLLTPFWTSVHISKYWTKSLWKSHRETSQLILKQPLDRCVNNSSKRLFTSMLREMRCDDRRSLLPNWLWT